MKIIWYKIGIAIVGIFVIIALLIAIYYKTNLPLQNDSMIDLKQQYILREYMEKIAVFKDGSETPSEVLNVYVSTLPAQDQMELISGIIIETEAELRDILEDFES